MHSTLPDQLPCHFVNSAQQMHGSTQKRNTLKLRGRECASSIDPTGKGCQKQQYPYFKAQREKAAYSA
jgi:hypothetical protein